MRSVTIDFYAGERASVGRAVALQVDRRDPRLDDVLPSGARLEQVAGGFESTAGPVWSRDGALLFSSPATNAVYRWDPRGRVTVFRPKSGYSGFDIGRFMRPGSSGLAFDTRGRLLLCQHGSRRLLRVESHGNATVLADRYRGALLNSPHDVVCRTDATVYFTDPPLGLPGGSGDPDRELPFSGVYAVREGGEVSLVGRDLDLPTGLALSPDERHLYVGSGDAARRVVMRYRVEGSGDAGGAAVFVDMTAAPGDGAIGGLAVDQVGNLYACGPGGIWVLSARAQHLGTLRLPEPPSGLAWGDGDGRTLYVTAGTGVYRLQLGIAGALPRQHGAEGGDGT
jgi:gluconolactonase